MAQGDVKTGMISAGTGARFFVQPPAGEHWLVKRATSNRFTGTAPDVIPDIAVSLSNGTVLSHLGDTTPANSARLLQRELNIGINNAIYLSLTNANAEFAFVGYSALQIK